MDFPRQIAVRVDQCETTPIIYVLSCKRTQQTRLPDAGLSDDITVKKAIGLPNAKHPCIAMMIGLAQN